MLCAQKGVCAICKNLPLENQRLCVDHDHMCCPGFKSCGKCVRGLLCHRCNTSLGKFEDNVQILLNAVEYLKETHGRTYANFKSRDLDKATRAPYPVDNSWVSPVVHHWEDRYTYTAP